MSVSGFEEFAEAVAGQKQSADNGTATRFQKITVLGGGPDARMLAALCLSEGAEVTLFSAYGSELDALRKAGGITIRGDGPVGTYQVDQDGIPSIKITAELDKAVAEAELIFLTGPVHKQRTYSMVLADHVRDGQILVLAPGRTLGAAETAWLLRIGGKRADVTIVESQALPYWYEVSGSTLHLSAAAPVSAATLPANRQDVLAGITAYLPNIAAALSTVHSGFADGSGLVEVPALLLGGPALPDGMPELPIGGVPLETNRNFRTLLGAGHLAVMERLAEERAKVASAYGVRDLPTLDDWLDIHAGQASGAQTRPVPSEDEAQSIIRCATIGSLVPLASAGILAGCATPATDAIIALASSVLEADIASAGRKLENIGIDAASIEDARRILDTIAKGRAHG